MSNDIDPLLVGVFVEELLIESDRLYKILEKDTHQSSYTLLGKTV